MRTYNIILKKGIDYNSFWTDMETETDGLLYIPNRKVDIENNRDGSLRQCWYNLTEEEADIVRQDDRVLEVEIPPEHRDDLQLVRMSTQSGQFEKTTSDSGSFLNWGLVRVLSEDNIYGTSSVEPQEFNYTLTGNGVDVIIQDSGIQIDHPEFEDSTGTTRFESIDWGSYSGGAFTQDVNHDRDLDGHGTHVAGIACGKTYGWAKNAKVLHQKIAGLEGTGDSGTGISPTYAFDAIKAWHNAKTIDSELGYKRPTVVNMSWGYLTTFTNATLTEINYRGTSYTGTDIDTTTERQNNYGLITNLFDDTPTYSTNIRITSVDTDIEEMVDAGIIVCIAAGNRSFKIDVSGGTDYDNYYVSSGNTRYYHRGSSPNGDTAILVGSTDSTVQSSTQDQKATYSETGPGVDVYAPGTNIMSCTSNTNKFDDAEYYVTGSFRQCNISGTSMATPQVVGVIACYLELEPSSTPSQVKSWIERNAGTALYDTGVDNDWTDFRSLKGGTVRHLFQPFFKAKPLKLKGVSL